MENTEINNLIASRPNAYGWLGFQRFLLFIFFILAIIFLFNAFCIVIYGLVEYVLMSKAANELADEIGHREEIQDLVKHFDPIKYKAILYSFFLSLSFFIIARYCQKTINRNRYILRLEEELKKFHLSGSH